MEMFLVWRIRELAEAGKLLVNGDWTKGWKEITVVLPGGDIIVVEEIHRRFLPSSCSVYS